MARHLSRRIVGASLALFSLIQGGTAHAAHKLTGKDIKNGTLTLKDFKQGQVASADQFSTFKQTLKSYAEKWNGTLGSLTDLGSWKVDVSAWKGDISAWKLGTDTLTSSLKGAVTDLSAWKTDVSAWKADTDTSISNLKGDLPAFLKIDSAASQFLKIDGTATNAIKWNGLTSDQVVLGDGSVRAGNAVTDYGKDSKALQLIEFGKLVGVTTQYAADNGSVTFTVTNLGDHALRFATDSNAGRIGVGQAITVPVSVSDGGGLETAQIIDPADPATSATLTLSAVWDVQAEKINMHATLLGTGE